MMMEALTRKRRFERGCPEHPLTAQKLGCSGSWLSRGFSPPPRSPRSPVRPKRRPNPPQDLLIWGSSRPFPCPVWRSMGRCLA
jgi:hypothetical protein